MYIPMFIQSPTQIEGHVYLNVFFTATFKLREGAKICHRGLVVA